VIVDDSEIRELNRSYLGRDFPTDVIAFPGDGDLLGEIVCSVNTAERQARVRAVSLVDELTLLAVHGMLHLMGYDDLSLSEWRKMKRAEFETLIELI